MARIPDFKSRIYSPLRGINDVSFDIETDQIKELLGSKTTNKSPLKLKITTYKYNESREIEFQGIENLPKAVKAKMKELFLSKAEIVWGSRLSEWISSHKFTQENGGWFTYEDESGVLDVMEIKLKFIGQKLRIIEKKPTGTLRTEYNFKKMKWSNNLLVLSNVKRQVYEGNQNIKIESTIYYKNLNEFGWVPNKIISTSVQSISMGTSKKVERKINENFKFTNFTINKDISRNWFSTHK